LKKIVFIVPVVFFVCCGKSSSSSKSSSPQVAKAGDEILELDEFKEHFFSANSKKDSNYLANKTIEKWATEALFYQEAIEKLNKDEMYIEREVKNYKKSLVNYIYQTKLIDANLDTNISKQEIEEYYQAHRDNFILNENIIKVNYFKIPIKAPGLEKIKRLLYLNNPKDIEQLKSLCAQNAENFFLNDSTWLLLDDIKKEIPQLKDQPDFNLVAGRVLQFNDVQYYYYLKVNDLKTKNSLSPINFERQNIKNLVINNRKTQLIKEYKQLLFEKAKSEKRFIVY
jgi:hypothetical protein